MNVSLYQAAAGMNANSRWQEVIADNLAASSIPGARKKESSFAAVEAGLTPGVSATNGGKIMMPSLTTGINLQQGTIRTTGIATDLALEGPGFLEVQLPDGTRAYTRDGELHLSAQGQLVNKQGYAVLGDSGPVQLDVNNSAPLSIGPGGEISQGGELKSRLRLTEFNDPKLLTPIGDGLLLADNSQLRPSLEATSTQVRQGFLEGANISPTVEMASLLTAMRLFEANQKVLQTQDERMGRVISDLGNPS